MKVFTSTAGLSWNYSYQVWRRTCYWSGCHRYRCEQWNPSLSSGSINGRTNGSFAIAVGLNWGVNHLRFETYVGSNKISNNMEIIDFTLHRAAHCLKDGNTLSLPTNTATGNPLFWISSKPGIVSVDSSGHILTANADGWAWVYANVGTLTIWRAVGVSSATNYVPTYPGDPFYKPRARSVAHTSGPIHVGMACDLNGKYWVGGYDD